MCAVDIDHVKVKFPALGIFPVRAENDSLAIWVHKRSKRRTTKLGDLSVVLAVSIHHPDLELGRANHVVLQQGFVII